MLAIGYRRFCFHCGPGDFSTIFLRRWCTWLCIVANEGHCPACILDLYSPAIIMCSVELTDLTGWLEVWETKISDAGPTVPHALSGTLRNFSAEIREDLPAWKTITQCHARVYMVNLGLMSYIYVSLCYLSWCYTSMIGHLDLSAWFVIMSFTMISHHRAAE